MEPYSCRLIHILVAQRARGTDFNASWIVAEARAGIACVAFLHGAIATETRDAEWASHRTRMATDAQLAADNDRSTIRITTKRACGACIKTLRVIAVHARHRDMDDAHFASLFALDMRDMAIHQAVADDVDVVLVHASNCARIASDAFL